MSAFMRSSHFAGVVALLVATVCLCPGGVVAQEVEGCGNLANAFGPFDYRDPMVRQGSPAPLALVEGAHFTPKVESLRGGQSGYLIGDIDYTLRAFPNHPRALLAVSKYELEGRASGRPLRWAHPERNSANCYFRRAIKFAPEDETVRMLYAGYLHKRGDHAAAKDQYDEALRLAPGNAEVNYNAGLFYLSQGDYAKAQELADVAYELGYPLPGLRKRLAEIGRK